MEQNHIIIDVSTKKYPMQFAIIDAEDVEKVGKKHWYVCKCDWNGYTKLYPATKINGKLVRLHRFIMNAKKGQIVDHINNNGLDNRKSNLRFVTHQQSMWNRKLNKLNNKSRFEGVSRVSLTRKLKKPFYARISENGKLKHLGYFSTENEAHETYEKEATRIKGEYKRKEE